MTDAQRVLVLREAVYNMGKLLREHPIDMNWYCEDPPAYENSCWRYK